MRFLRLGVVLATLLCLSIVPVLADDVGSEDETDAEQPDASPVARASLSPYWGIAIKQWEKLIVHWSEQKHLAPDLVAAVIYKESLGQPNAEYYGAVGLMMVMPSEYGFTWRPSAQELFSPSVNIKWGTGILAQIIRDSGGELVDSLAAYNGGWEQIHIPSTRRYSQSVLSYYAYAIAGHYGYTYQESKNWTMVLVTWADGELRQIETASSGGHLVPCFADLNQLQAGYPDYQTWPHSVAAWLTDLDGHEVVIDVWVLPGRTNQYVESIVAGVTLPTASHIGTRP